MPGIQQLLPLLFGALLAFSGVYYLRTAWLSWRLRRQGVRVMGELTRRRVARGVVYWARFCTLTGQVVEGKSRGAAWRDPGQEVGEEVVVRYEPSCPSRFMLESELTVPSLLTQLLGGLLLLLGALINIGNGLASVLGK